jgi:hypothetical protein
LLPFANTSSHLALAGIRPKIYFKKEENFRPQKSVRQAPRFTTQFTTTSPRFTIKKHHKKAKTPLQKRPSTTKTLFSNSQPENPSG